jgi:hypothetical protein
VGAEHWDEQVGSVADEATRLLESLRRSAAEAAAHPTGRDDGPDSAAPGAAPGSPGDGAAPAPAAAPHDPFCTWCPLCRGAAVVRSLSPETLTRLADLAALAATVLTDLASGRATGDPPASDGDRAGRTTGPDDGPPRHATRPASRARRPGPAAGLAIPVTDADDPQEAPRG